MAVIVLEVRVEFDDLLEIRRQPILERYVERYLQSVFGAGHQARGFDGLSIAALSRRDRPHPYRLQSVWEDDELVAKADEVSSAGVENPVGYLEVDRVVVESKLCGVENPKGAANHNR